MKIRSNVTIQDWTKMIGIGVIYGVMLSVVAVGFLEYYLNPVLEGFIIMTDYFEKQYGEDANYFLEIAEFDVEELTDQAKEKIELENWETMTEDQGVNKMYGILDQVTGEVRDRIWAIILFFVTPLLVSPLVLWIMIRLGFYCADKTIKLSNLTVDYKKFRIWRE